MAHHKMFFADNIAISIMKLNKNDVKRNKHKSILLTSFYNNNVAQKYLFHYQHNHNTCCNLKFAINITRQQNRLTNCHQSSQSDPFCLSRVLSLVYPWGKPQMMRG